MCVGFGNLERVTRKCILLKSEKVIFKEGYERG